VDICSGLFWVLKVDVKGDREVFEVGWKGVRVIMGLEVRFSVWFGVGVSVVFIVGLGIDVGEAEDGSKVGTVMMGVLLGESIEGEAVGIDVEEGIGVEIGGVGIDGVKYIAADEAPVTVKE
jgi:hypothetical protein